MPVLYPVPSPRTWTGEKVTPAKLRDLGNAIAFLRQKPMFQGYQLTAQPVATATHQALNWDTEMIDTWGQHSTSSNPSRWVAPVAGWYWVTGRVFWDYTASSSANQHSVTIRTTSGVTPTDWRGETRPGASTHTPGAFGGELVQMAAGDYVEIAGYQGSGSTQNTRVDSTPSVFLKTPMMTVQWVAATSGTTGLSVPSPAAFASPLTSAQFNAYRDAVKFMVYPPIARLARASTTQSIASGTWPTGTAITFDTATVDNYAGWNSGVNPTRYTIPATGMWLLYGLLAYSGNTAGTRACGLRVNAGTTDWGTHDMPATVSSTHRASAVHFRRLTAGDYVELMAFQSSGSNRTTQDDSTHLVAIWMGS